MSATTQIRAMDRPVPAPTGVFGNVRALDARSLAGPAIEVTIPAGCCVVHAGDEIGTFFVIRSGSAELRAGERQLATLEPGDCFGEIDAVGPGPQRFDVVARTPMRLLTFSAFGITRLCATIPGVHQRLLDSLPAA
jgi:CRP-like cAMP-binding protein